MSVNYTSIEQSKKLLELGLSPESADMVYPCLMVSDDINKSLFDKAVPLDTALHFMHTSLDCKKHDILCWSVGALLEVMPQKGMWALREERSMDFQYSDIDKWTGVCESYLDACYNMVVYLLENGYIKKVE